jgi:hypothetical protein
LERKPAELRHSPAYCESQNASPSPVEPLRSKGGESTNQDVIKALSSRSQGFFILTEIKYPDEEERVIDEKPTMDSMVTN